MFAYELKESFLILWSPLQILLEEISLKTDIIFSASEELNLLT